MRRIFQMILCLVTLFIYTCNTAAITIDSSSGFDASYPATNTIDGIYGNNNMGQARFIPVWAIYDLGANPQTIRKFRITPPLYGGTPPVTYNPRSGTIEFSNDKITWTAAINWSMPALESIARTDYAEIALPAPMTYRYVRVNFSYGRISEIFFLPSPQLAVWEMAQDSAYSNLYPAIRTCDGDAATFAASVNSEGSIIYDQGSSKYFCGFVMTSRNSSTSYNPTGGSVYVSNDPAAATWTLVGSWTLPNLTNGNKGIVTFTASQAQSQRYIKLVNNSGGSQWAEFECLFPIVNTNTAKTAIIIPDGITISNKDTFVYSDIPALFAAKELRYHIKKATQNNVVLEIYNETNKPATLTNFIYLGNCAATAQEGLSAAGLTNSQAIISCKGGNLFILGDDTATRTLGSGTSATTMHYLLSNDTRVGTLLGVYDFLENQLGVRWLWPGATGEYIPVKTDIIISPYEKTVTPKFIHSRLRDSGYYTIPAMGWANQDNCAAFMDNQQQWLRRHGFVRNVSMDYGHSFTTWWTQYSATHPEYFNLLPDSTRRADPYYWSGNTSLISMCLSNTGMHTQKITDWLASRSSFRPWVQAAENDTNTKCTCTNCMNLDVWNSSDMTQAEWNNRLATATASFNQSSSAWSTYLGSMSDRLANYLIALQTEATSRDNGNPASVVAYAYANYRKPPVTTQLNDRIILGYVPLLYFPWTQSMRTQTIDEMTGWMGKGASTYLRPNYLLSGHNYPIFFADKFGTDFSAIYAGNRMLATDFDSLTGQYGAQALNLYMVARMNSKAGELNQAQICDEFYAAFGDATTPTAIAVKAYFDYLKSVSDALPDTPTYDFYNFFMTSVDTVFPQAVRTQMRYLMDNAINAAANTGNQDIIAKVDFLNKGLTHAEKTLAAADAWQAWVTNGTDPTVAGGFNDLIYALDTFRGENEALGTSNFHWLRYMEDRYWYNAHRNQADGYDILPYSFNVSCGNMFILHGDLLFPPTGISGFFCRNYYGNDICLVLDLGSVRKVDKIVNTNRTDTATNYNIKNIQVYVASDESSPTFNKYNQASYTLQKFSGSPSPSVNTAGTARTADITNVEKRYLLIKVTSNFWGNIIPYGELSKSDLYSYDFNIVEY